ncbi:hypothetical protein P6U16_04560 [Rhizobium sp. 32-5/1]|nr:hypothetical protein [Rhizobium sp. 32-5/1]WEZ84005.1 hypothetical protein P6U16_04560 [Rhizobium sp. 32-5/1]
MGFTREEALIAISDAADAELADLTESASGVSGPNTNGIPFGGFLH